MVKAEKVGDRQVRFTFDVTGNRELPMHRRPAAVLPKHFWEAPAATVSRAICPRSTLEIPLGSGPYRIKDVDAGRTITFERVKDWWAKDLPVAKGQWNFDEIKLVYFRDRGAGLRGLQGRRARLLGRVERQELGHPLRLRCRQARPGRCSDKIPVVEVAPMQAFALNVRRPQFQDPRVRRAFNLAFNFEWANKNLFYDEYQRVDSYFDNSELKATGLPQGRELEFLNEVRDQVPPEVFTTEWKNPVNAGPDEDGRKNLALAAKLLAEAGYKLKDGVLTNAAGVQLQAEFLNRQPDFERIILPYMGQLQKLGIKTSLRTVDTSQFQVPRQEVRLRHHHSDFPADGIPRQRAAQLLGLGGGRPGGQLAIVIGIKNPAIDKLIEQDHPGQGPPRPGGRHARARPRVAVEPLRRAAMACALRPPRHVELLRTARHAADARSLLPARLVVGRGQGQEDDRHARLALRRPCQSAAARRRFRGQAKRRPNTFEVPWPSFPSPRRTFEAPGGDARRAPAPRSRPARLGWPPISSGVWPTAR